jgi:hypothetical protein
MTRLVKATVTDVKNTGIFRNFEEKYFVVSINQQKAYEIFDQFWPIGSKVAPQAQSGFVLKQFAEQCTRT